MSICTRESCSLGYTLCWSRGGSRACLIDLDGREVHSWQQESGLNWHDVKMLPDGHLLVVANRGSMYDPAASSECRLIELDRHGTAVWDDPSRVHHDAQRLASGNTLAVCNAPAYYSDLFDRPINYDYLIEITSEHRVEWSWHFAAHADGLADLSAVEPPPSFGDWPHINTVERLPHTRTGEVDDRFREGNLLVSPRHLHLIFVIDRDSGEIVWHWGRGEILGPHQPTMLPDGHILLFDNGWGPPMRGWSRVVEMDPLSGEIVWEYRGDPEAGFWSPVGSGAQRLPNGNTLICAMNWSEPGRIFEVTPDGETVWEYWNPEGESFYRAVRYDADVIEELFGDVGRGTAG